MRIVTKIKDFFGGYGVEIVRGATGQTVTPPTGLIITEIHSWGVCNIDAITPVPGTVVTNAVGNLPDYIPLYGFYSSVTITGTAAVYFGRASNG